MDKADLLKKHLPKELAIVASVVIFRIVMKTFIQNRQFYDQAESTSGAMLRLLPCRAK